MVATETPCAELGQIAELEPTQQQQQQQQNERCLARKKALVGCETRPTVAVDPSLVHAHAAA